LFVSRDVRYGSKADNPARFFSYRYATHRDEPSYGRQISIIGLKG
jgi:copper oxidase (laccase) domain-containing protein